jgi:hypothetical protein
LAGQLILGVGFPWEGLLAHPEVENARAAKTIKIATYNVKESMADCRCFCDGSRRGPVRVLK